MLAFSAAIVVFFATAASGMVVPNTSRQDSPLLGHITVYDNTAQKSYCFNTVSDGAYVTASTAACNDINQQIAFNTSLSGGSDLVAISFSNTTNQDLALTAATVDDPIHYLTQATEGGWIDNTTEFAVWRFQSEPAKAYGLTASWISSDGTAQDLQLFCAQPSEDGNACEKFGFEDATLSTSPTLAFNLI